MFTVRVIPIARGVGKEELSYFSPHAIAPGMVVEVPLRKRMVPALTVAVEEVRLKKAELRSGSFTLRRIGRKEPRRLVSAAFVEAARETALWHALPTGAVLASSIPSVVLAAARKVDERPSPPERPAENLIGKVLQATREHRVEIFRSLIREAFARGTSAFVMAPTVAEAAQLFEALERGIGEYAYLLTSTLTRTEYLARHQLVLVSDHPVLVVGTPSILSIPRHDLGLVIVDREASPLYRLKTKGAPDMRLLARYLAKHRKAELVRADLPLSIHGIRTRDIGKVEELVTGHHRMTWKSAYRIIDQTRPYESPPERTVWHAIGRELTDELVRRAARKEHVFLYAARRGLSPITICRDCGHAVACNECGSSVVLHKGKEENYFLCHSCGAMRHAREVCTVCRSWRLESLGIGVELIERELQALLPETPTTVLSSDSARTHAAALKTYRGWREGDGGILVGTELALPYLCDTLPFTAIVSLDSLLSFPSWTTYERIASIVTRIREVTGELLLLQTRRATAEVLEQVLSGNFSGYYKRELTERKRFGYPPFSTLVKVSALGTQEEVQRAMDQARSILEPFGFVTLSHFLRASQTRFLMHGFLRVPRETWPDRTIVEHLARLPPNLTVMVDPETVL